MDYGPSYLSIEMTRTPLVVARLSMKAEFHLLPNIGPQKRMTGNVVSKKLLVVE